MKSQPGGTRSQLPGQRGAYNKYLQNYPSSLSFFWRRYVNIKIKIAVIVAWAIDLTYEGCWRSSWEIEFKRCLFWCKEIWKFKLKKITEMCRMRKECTDTQRILFNFSILQPGWSPLMWPYFERVSAAVVQNFMRCYHGLFRWDCNSVTNILITLAEGRWSCVGEET